MDEKFKKECKKSTEIEVALSKVLEEAVSF